MGSTSPPSDGIDFDLDIGPCGEDGSVPVSYRFASIDDAVAYTRLSEGRAVAAVVHTALARGHSDPSLAVPAPESGRRGLGTPSGKPAHPDYYDQNTSPLPKRRYLDLARQGAFPRSKIGKQVLARRVDVDAFIANRAVMGRPSAAPPSDLPPDEMDEVLARAGLRRRS